MQPTEKYQVPRADIPQVSAPIRLGGHPSRSTKLKGFSGVIYGASFVIVGLFAARFTVVRYLSGEANTVGDVRLAFLLLFASTFLLGGIFFCTHGLRDVLGEARKKRLSLEQPNKPWLGDYAWRQGGFKFSASREASKPLLTALIGRSLLRRLLGSLLGIRLLGHSICLLSFFPYSRPRRGGGTWLFSAGLSDSVTVF